MKIISLTMSAFSTYKEKTTIDFEHMIEHGLYLISGPTGSGKTTIFDAISFALYGVASGSHRQQAYFRSDYASNDEETYVELTFELAHKIYTIKRSPTYTRPGYKTPKNANAYLMYDDQIIEGVKEVNAKINQLLGVDVNQFKQIVMIAQGEFTKLIYASSEEREKVLRHIFHSEGLLDFENILREETKNMKDQYLFSSQKLSSKFLMLHLSDEFMSDKGTFLPHFIDEAINENDKIHILYQEKLKQYQKIKQDYDICSKEYLSQKQINQDIEEYEKLTCDYQSLHNESSTYDSLLQDINKLKLIEQNQTMIYRYHQSLKDIHDACTSLETYKHTKQHKDEQFQTLLIDYNQRTHLYRQKEQITLEIQKIKELIEKQKTYQDLSSQYNQFKISYQASLYRYDSLKKTHQNLLKRIERDEENVNTLPSLELALAKDEQLVKELNQKRTFIHDLSSLFDTYNQVQDKHYELSEIYQHQVTLYKQALAHYQQEDENFKRQQAGILASTLQDNTPCPVCGSLIHPSLATLSSHVYTSKELEELSLEVEKQLEKKDQAYNEVYLQNELMNETKTKINVYKKQLEIEEELTKEVFIRLLSEVIQITKNYEATYHKRYEEVSYLKRLRKSLMKDKEVYNEQTVQLDHELTSLHESEKILTAYQAKLEQLLSEENLLSDHLDALLQDKNNELEHIEKHLETIESSYTRLQNEISVLTEQISSLQNHLQQLNHEHDIQKENYFTFIKQNFTNEENYLAYKDMLRKLPEQEKTYQDYIVRKHSLLSRITSLKELIKEHQHVDLSTMYQKLNDLDTLKEETFKQSQAYETTYQQNKSLLQSLQKDYLDNQDILTQYTMYQDLYDISSGKNTQRMSFERYVLSSYFEHILEYANIELLKMTNGRFEMKRKQVVKGIKQQGLDLSVLDYETGMMRDIQSLSGGESFKAALSLALGLSSMIQSYAGGIELNTLFIDEGFGALDNESLASALSVLLDMKNDNKVIGIISHVDELKERIATKIVVDKGTHGSHIYIETD